MRESLFVLSADDGYIVAREGFAVRLLRAEGGPGGVG